MLIKDLNEAQMRLTHEVNLKISVDSIQGKVLFSPLFGSGWGERAKGKREGR